MFQQYMIFVFKLYKPMKRQISHDYYYKIMVQQVYNIDKIYFKCEAFYFKP
jgi:hypothetical protein